MQARFKLAVLKKSIIFTVILSVLISTQVMAQTCGTTNITTANVFGSSGPSWAAPGLITDGNVSSNPWIPDATGNQWAYVMITSPTVPNPSVICHAIVKFGRWNWTDFIIQGTNTDPATTTPTWINLASVTNNSPSIGPADAYSYNDVTITNTTAFKYIRLYLPSPLRTNTNVLELELYSPTTSNTPPTINITGPANNATFVQGSNITITADANDVNGVVTKVEFFNGATLLGTVTAAPYLYVWNNVQPNTYTIDAKATDDGGATTTATITIAVTTPPPSSGTWSVTGNAGITPATQFLGTTDAQPLIIKTSGIERGRFDNNGALLIGTASLPAYSDANTKLAVNGPIWTTKLKVTQTGWSDFVFAKNYKLPTLAEVEAYIKAHQHLPGIASAKEVTSNGLDVGNNQAALLQKIEELTLYVIELNKKLDKHLASEKQNKKAGVIQKSSNKVSKHKK